MLKNEVDYRIAKWLLACMEHDGVISGAKMREALKKAAELYNPPLL